MATSDFKVGKGVVAQNASTFTSGSFTGQITSTLATGTSPFAITSTTVNTNLNADLLDGQHASAFAAASHTHAISTDITGLGTGVATFLATPSSANLLAAVTDETGTGALVFGTSPAITTSLTTPSTTFSLINTTATTVNFAGAATTLSIGAGSGTTTVNNNLTVSGNLTVNGTTTTVNSTIVSVDDVMIMIGGDTAPSTDDNLDRGVQFRWHNGTTAKLGFFGFDDSTGYFTFIPDATDTSGVMSGTIGTLDVAAITGSAASVTNSVTFNTTGGAAAGTTYNGSTARTIDYTTVGAAASSHTHGNINNNGTIGAVTSSGYVITTTTGGALQAVNGTTSQWLRGDGTFTAVTLGNSQVIKFDTGTTEGTDLYTFNGSAAKTIDIKAGTNISLAKTAGAITISSSPTSVGAVTVDTGAYLDYNAVTISANTATTIHSFAGGTYRSAKFLVQLTQGTKYRVSEVVVLHDGTTAYAAEYGIIEAGGTMSGITVDATYSAGTINLTATVTDAATTNVAAKAFEIAVVA